MNPLQIAEQFTSAIQTIVNLRSKFPHMDFELPKLVIKKQRGPGGDTISVQNDSGTGYQEYNRLLWERIIRHGHPSLFPNHLKNCKEQYLTRKPTITRSLEDDHQIKIERDLILDDMSKCNFTRFKYQKSNLELIERQLVKNRTSRIDSKLGMVEIQIESSSFIAPKDIQFENPTSNISTFKI
jgi:hypothetical protein